MAVFYRMTRAAKLFLALTLVTSAERSASRSNFGVLEVGEQQPSLRVVHINDVYSLKNMPKLKTLVQEARKGAKKTLFTVGGDFLAPYLLSTFDKGAGMVKCLNEIGVDFVIFGNHEIDVGVEELNQRIKEITSAGALWINSNMPDFYNKSGISALNVPRKALPPFADVKIDLEGAQKTIRLLGVLTAEVGTMSGGPEAFSGAAATLQDPAETVISMTREATEADFVLPLVHLYLDAKEDSEITDRRLAEEIEKAGVRDKIIALLGSHDHPKAGMHETLAGGLQLTKGAMDASHAAILDIYFGDGRARPEIRLEPVDKYSADAMMATIVQKAESALEPIKSMVLGKAHIQEMFPGKHISWPLSSEGVREGPSNMASLMASLMTRAAKCDFSVVAGGAIRADQVVSEDGISVSHILSELPFNNQVLCLPIPGYLVAESIHQTRDIGPGTKNAGYAHADLYVDVAGSGRDYTVTSFSKHAEGTDRWTQVPFDYEREVDSDSVKRFEEAMKNNQLSVKSFTDFDGMQIFHVGQITAVPPEDKRIRQLYEHVQDWWPSKDAGLPQHTLVFGFIEEWLKSHIVQLLAEKLKTVLRGVQPMATVMQAVGQSQYDDNDVDGNYTLELELKTLLSHVEQQHAKDVNLLNNFGGLDLASLSPLLAAATDTAGVGVDEELRESAKQLLDTLQAFFAIQKILKKDMSMDLKSQELRHPKLASFLELGKGSAASALASAQQRLRHQSLTVVPTIFQAGLLKQLSEDGNLLDHLVQATDLYVQALSTPAM